MSDLTLLVLGDAADPHLGDLARRAPGVRFVVGDRLEALAEAAPEADALLLWSGPRALFEQVLGLCRRLRWVHSRWAGVADLLAGDLAASPLRNLVDKSRGY